MLSRMRFHSLKNEAAYRRRRLSEGVFPDGRSFEDVATTYKLVRGAVVTGVPEKQYHWIQRKSSISQNHERQNLVDYWLAHKQRYEDLKDSLKEEIVNRLLEECAIAI